jgi:hypothetical protein
MAIRTDVFAWEFSYLVTDGGGKCKSGIKDETAVSSYQLAGQKEVSFPPKNPDPKKPEDTDFIKFFKKNKWTVTPMNPGADQPETFSLEATFEKLSLDFTATGTCECLDPKSCNKKSYHLTVSYDAASNKGPEVKFWESTAGKCDDNQKPNRKISPKISQNPLVIPQESFEARVDFSSEVPCPCDPKPCEVTFGVRYGFKSIVVAD